MRQDKFLFWILIGIGVVTAAALVLFFSRRVELAYLPEDTPSGVVNNFVVALHDGDYKRAYTYVAEGKNKPSYPVFRQAYLSDLNISGSSLVINDATEQVDEAVVGVTIITSYGPFAETNRQKDNAALLKQDGLWKINLLPYPYWRWEWLQPDETIK